MNGDLGSTTVVKAVFEDIRTDFGPFQRCPSGKDVPAQLGR